MSQRAIFIANDNLLVVTLSNARTGVAINAAAVLVTLRDVDGVAVSGQAWPQAVVYESGSDGVYVGGLEDTLALERGVQYIAHITVDAGGGLKASWKTPLEAMERIE